MMSGFPETDDDGFDGETMLWPGLCFLLGQGELVC